MDAHEMSHKLAVINHHIKEAIKHLAPYYTTETGVNVHEHLRTANAYLDGIDNQLLHELIKGEK